MYSGVSLQDEAQRRITELEHENAKLRKINAVLINRVERGAGLQGDPFSLFQTAIELEAQVRDRTRRLRDALAELEQSNQALRQAKEEAETAQVRLATAIESVSEGFVLCDAQDRLVMCNSKYREFWPALAEIIQPGMPFSALVREAEARGLFNSSDGRDALQLRLQPHRQPRDLLVIKLADGRWLQISERSVADGGIVAIYTDITEIKLSEQRQRERELAEKNTLLQATFDTISQGVAVVDQDQRVVASNQRFLELLNIAPDQPTVGATLRDLIRLPILGFGTHADQPAGLYPICVEHITGTGRFLEIRSSPMPNGGMVSTYTDITERKASEWALRESEQRIRLITDAIPALIAYVDAGGRYRFTNKPYEDWFGRPRSEINGRHMRAVLGSDLFEARREHVDTVLAGRRVTFEISMPMVRGSIEHALATYVPHVGPNGDVLGFFALIQDITERKKAAEQLREAKEGLECRVAERTTELTALNTRLQVEVEERRQAQAALQVAKAEAEQANMSKTKFIAAASHDLLQPLNAARMFATALGKSRLAPRNRGFARNVITALNAVDELLCALLDISKLDAGVHATEIADFRIERLLTALCDEFGPQARARNLALRLVHCGAVVRTDAVLVGRILRNFLSNAMRYSPSGSILLGCRRRPGGLEVQVWDTGIGIPGDKLGEVFGEFRRLAVDSHDRDRGMGLGLAIVDRIARRLGHEITVRSSLGSGSVFGVVLPFGSAQRIRPQAATFALSGRLDRVAGAFVVVVENDEAARDGLSALLRSWHCTVLAADRAAAAVQALQAQPREPDVLIADYHLDGGEIGLTALATIRDCWARPIPGIITTADRTDAVRDAVRDAGFHLLNKPLKPARLRSLLAHVVTSDVIASGGDA